MEHEDESVDEESRGGTAAESPHVDESAVTEAVEAVTHPEIDATLSELGMIQGIETADGSATVTLALPMLNIPDVVKNILVSRLAEAVESAGAESEIRIVEMTDDQRERFFQLESEHWSGGIDETTETQREPDGPPF